MVTVRLPSAPDAVKGRTNGELPVVGATVCAPDTWMHLAAESVTTVSVTLAPALAYSVVPTVAVPAPPVNVALVNVAARATCVTAPTIATTASMASSCRTGSRDRPVLCTPYPPGTPPSWRTPTTVAPAHRNGESAPAQPAVRRQRATGRPTPSG